MSTTTSAADAAMQARIIAHMNEDHAGSLALYLRHYNNLPATALAAQKPTLETISLTHMIISISPPPSSSSGPPTTGRYFIPFHPPLRSYGSARERLVAMHETSRAAVGSATTVTTWRAPNRAWQVVVGLLSLQAFVAFSRRTNFVARAIYTLYSGLGHAPALAALCHELQPYVLPFMVVVHGAEAAWMARTRLRPHGVVGATWWLWMLSCFVEGFGSFHRFDDLVRDSEEERERKKETKGKDNNMGKTGKH